jgi:hypothetical protein
MMSSVADSDLVSGIRCFFDSLIWIQDPGQVFLGLGSPFKTSEKFVNIVCRVRVSGVREIAPLAASPIRSFGQRERVLLDRAVRYGATKPQVQAKVIDKKDRVLSASASD